MQENVFKERSLCVSSDLSIDEKRYLFEKIRDLKSACKCGIESKLDLFRINDPNFGIYEVFLEDSTRTRESFRNAANFHGAKVSMFNADSSSFNKKERRWRASIMVNGKQELIGKFEEEKEAAKAYDNAARKYRGEFAVLNFPPGSSWFRKG